MDVRHAAHHQHRHVDQRASGGVGRNHPGQGGEEHRRDEQDADHHSRQASATTCSDTRRALDIAGHRWHADHGAEHARGAVSLQGPRQVLDASVRRDQVGALCDAHQRAGGIEHVYEQKCQHHADHADVEHPGDIHGHPGRRQARRHRHHPAELDQPQAPAGQGHADDADEDGAEHPLVAEDGDQQEAQRRQQRARLVQRAELDQRGRAVDDDARGLQADQSEKQSDAGSHGMAQADRDAVEQPLAHFRQGQEHEQHARDEHCAQRRFPVVAHGADHGVGEECVQAHARCQAHRPVGVQAHEQAAECGGDAGGDERRAVVDAGVGHDVRVDEDDVRHGDEGGHPGDQFGAYGAAVLLEFENPLQPARFERGREIQRRGFGFAAFHSGTPQVFLVVLEPVSCAMHLVAPRGKADVRPIC